MRRNRLVFASCVLLTSFFLSCETADNVDAPTSFVKYFGGAGNQEGVDLVVNPDGTILLFGNTTLPGETNAKLYLAKSDANGNLLWERSGFGGPLKNQAKDIEVATDGSIILLANSEVATGDNDVLLIIADKDGNELNKVTHGYSLYNEDASSVTQTTDGFIVTGSTNNTSQKGNPEGDDQRDAFNFRFYSDLTSYPNTWNETLGPGTFDAGTKVIQVAPGQFYFFGYTNKKPSTQQQSVPNFNFWVFALNDVGNGSFDVGEEVSAGDILVDEKLSSVTVSPVESGEGFLLTGMRTDASGASSIYMAKLRRNLNFSPDQIDQVFQFPPQVISADIQFGQLQDLRTASAASKLSGFLVVSNESSLGNQNFYLTKITNTGVNAWASPKGYVFGGDKPDQIGAVAELPDGNILMIGTFSVGDDLQQKMTLIKVNKEGKFLN